MTKTDLLNHPDLNKVWDVLESTAPTVEWPDLTKLAPARVPTERPRKSLRKAIAVLAVLSLFLFTGNETVGVFAARRALAAQPAVLDQPIQLEVETLEVPEPWVPTELSDLTLTDVGIFANTDSSAGVSNQWQLSPNGWTSLRLDASLIAAGETFDGVQYAAGRVLAGELGDTAVIWRLDPGSEDWKTVLSVSGGHISSLVDVGGRLVAVGYQEYETPRAWTSTDGTSWTAFDLEQSDPAVVTSGASDGQTGVVVGFQDASLPLIELRKAAIWSIGPSGSLELVDVPNLDSLGFGYSIGGFRLSDGLEHVVSSSQGFVAYTGYLQVWDGFQGLTLDPREAWASLVLLSEDGGEWAAHVLTDFAIYQVVRFGDGLLAAAALPPESDTQIIDVDGVATEVASAAVNQLYYSSDGLTWQEVAHSPEFGKPLLATTDNGDVVAIDEYAAESSATDTTTVHLIRTGA